jgi:hypothetical protein
VLVASVGALMVFASSAWADVGLAVTTTFPSTATVGQTELPASIEVRNTSTAPESAGNLTINAIRLVPACGSTSPAAGGDCSAAEEDPGVFSVSSTGTGEAGTACAGQLFTISVIDPGTGQLSFTPTAGPVTLTAPATPNSVCRIDLTFSVLKEPTEAAGTTTPTTVPTGQIGFASGVAGDSMTGTGSGSSLVTVSKALPGFTPSATPTGNVGTPINDTGTLSAASPAGPTPTGTITFALYLNSPTCAAGAQVFTSTVTVDSGLTSYASGQYTPPSPGTYEWVASYSGDANDQAVSSSCGDAGQTSAIAMATPSVTTTASGAVTLGGTISDSATLSGGVGPTGTITFSVYGPDDATFCTGPPAFTSSATVVGNGVYGSAMFTPTAAGTYRFVASYGGDSNNSSLTPGCESAGESVTVNKVSPTVTTIASAGVSLGNPISDNATLTGGASTPTGTITFTVYGPDDATCTGTPAFTTAIPVSDNGEYSSGTLTPTAAGTYRFVASYSGDANNTAFAGTCGAANESVTVSPAVLATPAISTTASTLGTVGQPISDTAILSGGSSPTGTITFKLYGPNDSACAGPPISTSTATVAGNGSYASTPFDSTAEGPYGFVATYSGDANNAAVASACGDIDESVTISSAGPPPGPSLSSVTQSAGRWRAGNALVRVAGAKPPVGTTFSFTLNEAARVTFVFTDKVAGRKVKRRCVRATHGNRRQPACKRTATAWTLPFNAHAGTNRVSFQGRISSNRRLKLGSYTLTITATNGAGADSGPARLRFTIVK